MPATKVDWLALAVSVITLAILSYTELHGPHILLAVGHDVLITKTTGLGPRVGVVCSFVNEGARQTGRWLCIKIGAMRTRFTAPLALALIISLTAGIGAQSVRRHALRFRRGLRTRPSPSRYRDNPRSSNRRHHAGGRARTAAPD